MSTSSRDAVPKGQQQQQQMPTGMPPLYQKKVLSPKRTGILDALLEEALMEGGPGLAAGGTTRTQLQDHPINRAVPMRHCLPPSPSTASPNSVSDATGVPPSLQSSPGTHTPGDSAKKKRTSSPSEGAPSPQQSIVVSSEAHSGIVDDEATSQLPVWKHQFAASAQQLLRETRNQVGDLLHYKTSYEKAAQQILELHKSLESEKTKNVAHRAALDKERATHEEALKQLSEESLHHMHVARQLREEKANAAVALEVCRTENNTLHRELKEAQRALRASRAESDSRDSAADDWQRKWKESSFVCAQQDNTILRLEAQLFESKRRHVALLKQYQEAALQHMPSASSLLAIEEQHAICNDDAQEEVLHADESASLARSLSDKEKSQRDHILYLRVELAQLERQMNDKSLQYDQSLAEQRRECSLHHSALHEAEKEIHSLRECVAAAELQLEENVSQLHCALEQVDAQQQMLLHLTSRLEEAKEECADKGDADAGRTNEVVDSPSALEAGELLAVLQEVLPLTQCNTELLTRWRQEADDSYTSPSSLFSKERTSKHALLLRDIMLSVVETSQQDAAALHASQGLVQQQADDMAKLQDSLQRAKGDAEAHLVTSRTQKKELEECTATIHQQLTKMRAALREHTQQKREFPSVMASAAEKEAAASPHELGPLLQAFSQGILQLLSVLRDTKHQLQVTRTKKKEEVSNLEELLAAEKKKAQTLEAQLTQYTRTSRSKEQRTKETVDQLKKSADDDRAVLQRSLDAATANLERKIRECKTLTVKLKETEGRLRTLQDSEAEKSERLAHITAEHLHYTQTLRDVMDERNHLASKRDSLEEHVQMLEAKVQPSQEATKCLYVALTQMCRWVAWILMRVDTLIGLQQWHKALAEHDRKELRSVQEVLKTWKDRSSALPGHMKPDVYSKNYSNSSYYSSSPAADTSSNGEQSRTARSRLRSTAMAVRAVVRMRQCSASRQQLVEAAKTSKYVIVTAPTKAHATAFASKQVHFAPEQILNSGVHNSVFSHRNGNEVRPFLSRLSFKALQLTAHRLHEHVLPPMTLPSLPDVLAALRPLVLHVDPSTRNGSPKPSRTEGTVEPYKVVDYILHAMSLDDTESRDCLSAYETYTMGKASSVPSPPTTSMHANHVPAVSNAVTHLLQSLEHRYNDAEASLSEQMNSFTSLLDQNKKLSTVLQTKDDSQLHIAKDIAALEELLHTRPSPEAYAELRNQIEVLQANWDHERSERRKAQATAAHHHEQALSLLASQHSLQNEVRSLNLELLLATQNNQQQPETALPDGAPLSLLSDSRATRDPAGLLQSAAFLKKGGNNSGSNGEAELKHARNDGLLGEGSLDLYEPEVIRRHRSGLL